MDADKQTRRERCKEKAPMIAAELAEYPGWCKLWDHALDLGWKTVLGFMLSSCVYTYVRVYLLN